MVFVLGLLFPAAVAIIPLFIMISTDLDLGNTWWGVALPQAAFALPMTIVILRPFLMAFPNELEEAAVIDGASGIGFFWRILLPLSRPGLVTVGVLAFVGSWNAYLLPLLLLRKDDMKTLPLGVADFSIAVLLRHGGRPRVHLAGDDPRAGLLPRRCSAGSSTACRARSRDERPPSSQASRTRPRPSRTRSPIVTTTQPPTAPRSGDPPARRPAWSSCSAG